MRSILLSKLRLQASKKQNHRCYYCEFLMWHTDSAAFLRVNPAILARHAHHLECTAEHRVARQDGGTDTADNIVAACLCCNRMRHLGRSHKAPDAATYKTQVMRLVSLGRWHPAASSLHSRKRNNSLPADNAGAEGGPWNIALQAGKASPRFGVISLAQNR